MIWEATLIQQHEELLEQEFKVAWDNWHKKDKRARRLESDNERCVEPLRYCDDDGEPALATVGALVTLPWQRRNSH